MEARDDNSIGTC